MTAFEPPTYHPHPPKPTQIFSRWRINLIMAAAILIAAIAMTALYFAMLAWENTGTLKTQDRHLQSQVTSLKGTVSALQGQLSDLQSKQVKDYTAVGNDLVPLTQYAQTVCSSDLNGPKGPTQYYFLCTATRPASNSG